MATGDTKLIICSDALIMLGATPLTSFSDGTDAATICDRLYDDIRDLVLQVYPWTFSLKKSQVARTANTPASEWKYEYQLPSDRIGNGVRAVFTTADAGATPLVEGWEIVGDKLLTDQTSVYVDYQYQVTETLMPTYFIQLLKYWLAWHFAETVTDQVTKAQYFQVMAVGSPSDNMRGGVTRQCMQIDSVGNTNQSFLDFDLVTVRAS